MRDFDPKAALRFDANDPLRPGKKRRRLTGKARRWREYELASIPHERARAYEHFVWKHKLACFACGNTRPAVWAKTGWNRRGPWAVCLACVKRRMLEIDPEGSRPTMAGRPGASPAP
jgi:hypothetical protein